MVACRQSRRHAVPRREEPGGRHPHPRQLPALDALTRWPTKHRRCRRSSWSSASPNSPTRTCTRCARRPSAAIIDGGGFGWVNPPGRMALETYFRGVLLVPERELFVARLDGHVVGSAHLVRPPRNNEAQAHRGAADALVHRALCARPRPGADADHRGRGAGPRTRLPRAEPRRARDPGGGDPALRVARLRALGRAPGLRLRARPGGARLLLLQAAAPAGRQARAERRRRPDGAHALSRRST